jgi:aryl-alcohol dehydrogenase-like predicted oxidoreductase
MAVTNSPEHIKSYIEGTIERLGFTPDLYYLHRIDPSKYRFESEAPPNELADWEPNTQTLLSSLRSPP